MASPYGAPILQWHLPMELLLFNDISLYCSMASPYGAPIVQWHLPTELLLFNGFYSSFKAILYNMQCVHLLHVNGPFARAVTHVIVWLRDQATHTNRGVAWEWPALFFLR